MDQTPRTAGRRAGDKERAHLRRLELALRNFVTYFDDHRRELFAPRTQQLVDEGREVFKELDELRGRTRRPGASEGPPDASSEPAAASDETAGA